MKKYIFFIIFLIFSTFSIYAGNAYSLSINIDWETRILAFDVSLDLAKAGIKMPQGRSQALLMIQNDFTSIARNPILEMLLNSQDTIAKAVFNNDISADDLKTIIESAVYINKRFSDDFKYYSINITISFAIIEKFFIRHTKPSFQARSLDYVPTKAYTGIIIFAKKKLPVHGENTVGILKPCLFPKIYDQNMTLLYEKNMADPMYIKKWGLSGFSSVEDSYTFDERVGNNPLRIIATSIFGTERTDIIISHEDALKIIGNEQNRELLTQCKIIIICENTIYTYDIHEF